MVEKRREYGETDIITCPKCDGDDIDNDDSPMCGKCRSCGLEFSLRTVAVWEEDEQDQKVK